MNFKEFNEKYGTLDRTMLKLMLGIAPSKYDDGFSSVIIKAMGAGINRQAVIDKKTGEHIRLFLDLRVIKRLGDNQYLEIMEVGLRTNIKWGNIDDATIIDLKSAKKILKELQPNKRGMVTIKLFELVNVVK